MSETQEERISILIVEDNHADFKMIEYTIEDVPKDLFTKKYDLYHANYLESALIFLDENEYDVILLDLNLPDENGIETLRKIISKTEKTPVIVMTGMNSVQLAFEAIDQGAQDYLVKGEYNALTLVKSIHYAIARRTRQKISLELDIQQQKNLWLKQLIDDVSHDFRTPLSIIRTSLYLYRQTQIEEHLENIDEQTSRIESLIQDFIQVSKLDNNIETIKIEDVPMDEFFKKIVEEHKALADYDNKTLTYSGLSDIDCIVRGDRDLLYRAITNLLSNAFKYSPKGSNIVTSTHYDEYSELVSISIRDDGDGISEKDLPRIFDRFYRGDAARSNSSSTGLGLSIVKKISEIHHGTINIESEVGVGTVCIMSFPVHKLVKK